MSGCRFVSKHPYSATFKCLTCSLLLLFFNRRSLAIFSSQEKKSNGEMGANKLQFYSIIGN
jgi:hypothetical protein